MAKKYLKPTGRAYEDRLSAEGKKRKPMSGATWWDKEDHETEYLVIQAKATAGKSSYTLKKIDLQKVVREARLKGKLGVIYLDFSGLEIVISLKEDFEHLLQDQLKE